MTLHARNRRATALAAGLVAAFAVTASPALRAQQTPAPPAQTEAAENSGTLSLHQAVALAEQNSADLKLARMQYNVALREADVDRSAFRPNLYTGAGFTCPSGFAAVGAVNAPAVSALFAMQWI